MKIDSKYLKIISPAKLIEPDTKKLAHWFYEDLIVDLEYKTARDLVITGQGEALECYLKSILSGSRD